MQITLDLPDEAFALADAVAKRESRSLGSVIADFILRRQRRSDNGTPPDQSEEVQLVPIKPGHRFPVSEGRAFTLEEFERALEEDGLP